MHFPQGLPVACAYLHFVPIVPIYTSKWGDIWTTKTTSQNCECEIFTLQRESTYLPLVFTLKRALAHFWEMLACNTMAKMMMNLRKRCRGDGQMSLSCLLTSVIRIFVAPPRHWCHLWDVNLSLRSNLVSYQDTNTNFWYIWILSLLTGYFRQNFYPWQNS